MKNHANDCSAQPQVTFLGAAQSVTGSMHLVEYAGQRILLDCGLVRGPRDAEARARSQGFPFAPGSLDAVVLSHAHTDHCGNLPNLVRQGFRGPIYCTPATRELSAIMMADSARIYERTALVTGISTGKRTGGDGQPLYTQRDVEQTVQQMLAVPYEYTHEHSSNVELRFLDAGHILGSAVTLLTLGRGAYRITFTGDLGRRGLPFLPSPCAVPGADLVLCESTYGGRFHDSVESMATKMDEVIRTTAARGGKVLIPAFSLGRTQAVLHFLQQWMSAGSVPVLPIFVDSPLAADISAVYERYQTSLAEPLDPGGIPVYYLSSQEESEAVSLQEEPCIIVASGGMCEGGRIVHHLKHHLDDPRTTIVLVSYQAPGTVGHQLLEKRPTVRFHGRSWNKWADVVELNGFSGHAGHDDFLDLLASAADDTGKVCLVHGEPPQAAALAASLREEGFPDVEIPARGETVAVS